MTETTRFFYARASIELVNGETVRRGFYARHSDSFSAADTIEAGAEIAREIIYDWGDDELDAPVESVEITAVRVVPETEFWAAPRSEIKG